MVDTKANAEVSVVKQIVISAKAGIPELKRRSKDRLFINILIVETRHALILP